jgi:orotidine-5'-phosphate decarboxylase
VRPLSEVGSDDQKRTMTPSDAIAQGANYVVIGRPITSAWSNGPKALQEKAALIASEILGK